MNSLGYPKRKDAQKTGRTGEIYAECFVTKELGWIYRQVHRENDFGIDGYIDIVDKENVTGKSLAIQVKCGDSYINKTTPDGIKYEGSKQHLNLYLNLGVPVILVVVNGDGNEAYWVEFEIEKTSETPSGWWIEIPKTNVLDKTVAQKWKTIGGPTRDYSEEIQNFWATSEALKDSDLLAVAIPDDEVESLSMFTIVLALERLCKNKELLLSKRNKVEIFFPDYDNDERELHQIPEFRRWVAASITAGIPWFYFLNTREPCISLALLYACGCRSTVARKTEGSYYMETTSKDRDIWFRNNFQNLNEFTDSHSISLDINKEVSGNILDKYSKMMKQAKKKRG